MSVLASRRRVLHAGIALAALAFAGCSTLRMKQPTVTLADVEIQEFGLLEQRMGFRLRVLNPNRRELTIDGVSFEIEVNGREFAKGVSNKSVTVSGLSEGMLDLSAVTTLGDMLRQLGELARNGRDSVEYRIHGHFHGGGMDGVPFESTRELKIPKWLAPPPVDPPPRPSAGAGKST